MEPPDYKAAVREAIHAVYAAEIAVFTAMVNVGFSGEYSDIARLHEPGETMDLEVSMFEDTGDAYLDHLAALANTIVQTRLDLMNLAGMTEEELEEPGDETQEEGEED